MADGIIGYPFDSILTFDEQGNPTYDRAVTSKVLKTLISKLFTTGVMPNPSNNLLVTAGTEGMTTVVEEGFCVIEGGLKLIAEPQTMMHQASDTNYDRIDTVVMRWDNNDNVRHCGLFVVEGTPATSPVRPTLTREGSIYEIGLADVLIKANSTVISANRITDTRYDDERCGVVRSISEYDTTYIYQQVQADLAYFKEHEEAEFVEWFENLQYVLDEDVAGHLQNEIDDLRLNGGNSNLAPVESSTTATVATNAGKYVVVEGVLYKALSNIAIGDTYVSSGAGANIERKLVGDELAGINQNLTNCLIWNPEDDYAYVGGRKTNLKAGLLSVGVYVDGHYVENCEIGVMTQATWAPNVVAFTNDNTKLTGVVSTANTDSALKTVNQMYNINSKTLKIYYYTDADVTVREAVVQNVVNGYVYVNAHKNQAGKLVLYAGANPSALTSLVDSSNLPVSGISVIQTNVNITNNVYITKIEFVD